MGKKPDLATSFEELWIWQEARLLVHETYCDFGPGTICQQDFEFRNQVRSAALSVMNNIAEGFERESVREFRHFLTIAKGSCGEVRSMYYTAEDLRYVNAAIAIERRNHSKRISRGIASFQRHLR